MRARRTAGLLAGVASSLAAAAPAPATVTSRYVASFPSSSQGTLFVESDAADPIVVECSAGFVAVNGMPPQTGPLACSALNRLDVTGGPGDNRVDLSAVTLVPLGAGSRGVNSSARIDGGAGDDDIRGPRRGIVRIIGGPGSDRLEGNAIDYYLFGTAASPEIDTIAEPGSRACSPSFADTNRLNVTVWIVPWDALDFTALAAGDGLLVDNTAPAGLLARHRNRTVRLATPGGVALEAIAGGAGDDAIAGACMALGNDGDDRLAGTAARGDLVVGGVGADAVAGAGGPDIVSGGPGADTVDGGPGADTLFGGPGDDALAGRGGGDAYLFDSSDGTQSDTVVERPASGVDVFSLTFERSVVADLASGRPSLASAEGTTVLGDRGTAREIEGLIGGRGDDRLLGNARANHFWSGGGSDLVAGRGGDDTYHVNWVASMPTSAYGFWDGDWFGPFEREDIPSHTQWARQGSVATLRVLERARGGRDAIDLVERFAPEGDREPIDGQVEDGVRVDLSAERWLMRTAELRVQSDRTRSGVWIEIVRGTFYDDAVIGNAADNVLEGRQGQDVVRGGGGRDTCVAYGREDSLRGCERVRRGNPYR